MVVGKIDLSDVTNIILKNLKMNDCIVYKQLETYVGEMMKF